MIRVALCGILMGLAGCESTSLLMLPGEDDADTGAVAVLDPAGGDGETVIGEANSRTRIAGAKARTRNIAPGALSRDERALLDAMPPPPRSFTLNFREGTSTLVAGSDDQIAELFAEVSRRPGAEVEVIGHTDTVGASDDNDRLAETRAGEVAAMLVERGFDVETVSAIGRGERDLLVKTGDNVDEPRNRRVEVLVR